MGAGWIAIGLFLFMWALGWMKEPLRDGKKNRRGSMRDWIQRDEEDDI